MRRGFVVRRPERNEREDVKFQACMWRTNGMVKFVWSGSTGGLADFTQF
jgi:hypothetical protein